MRDVKKNLILNIFRFIKISYEDIMVYNHK